MKWQWDKYQDMGDKGFTGVRREDMKIDAVGNMEENHAKTLQENYMCILMDLNFGD